MEHKIKFLMDNKLKNLRYLSLKIILLLEILSFIYTLIFKNRDGVNSIRGISIIITAFLPQFYRLIVNRKNTVIEELIITDYSFEFVFLYPNKKPDLTMSRNDVYATVRDNYIVFKDRLLGKEIAKAYKNIIDEVDNWDVLLNTLNQSTIATRY